MSSRLPDDTRRPGWPELGAGFVALVLLFTAIVFIDRALPDDQPALTGILNFALSALLGLGAFAAALVVRLRRAGPFGVRRVRGRWVWFGASLGVVAYVLGIGVTITYITLTGDASNVQGDYQAAGGAGALSLSLTLLMGAVATPIGEELFWRGVVANALGRYGAWISVLVSAALFALAHGINPVLPVAFVVGVITALLFRHTGSIWPGVATHAVNNALSTSVPLVLALVAR